MKWIALVALRRWFVAQLKLRDSTVRYECVEEFPRKLKPFTLYVAGEQQHFLAAAMLCPCGCGDAIELNLLQQASPQWKIRLHPNGSVSLIPSVWRSKGCRSHFWLWNSRIEWC